jgi:hypothetical protein
MQKIAIIPISEEGKHISRLLLSQFFAQKKEAEIISRAHVGKRWPDFDAFVFIGAMGMGGVIQALGYQHAAWAVAVPMWILSILITWIVLRKRVK